VPIIEYQGYAVYESAICNEFLEDAFPVPALYPKSAFKRAEARLQMKLSETKVNL
jgi:glutathione S-transferase